MTFAPRPTVVLCPRGRGSLFALVAMLACSGGDRQGGNFVNMYDNAFNATVVRVPVAGNDTQTDVVSSGCQE